MYKTTPHVGEIVFKTFDQKGYTKNEIAKAIGMSRHGLYVQLDKADMSLKYVLKIGEYIGVDFLEMIPSLKKELVKIEAGSKEDEPENNELIEPHDDFEKVDLGPLQMTISLDGSEITLNQVIKRIKAINAVIASENH